MIKQMAGLQLLMMLFILTSLIHGRLTASQVSYVFPPNISIQILNSSELIGDQIRLAATLESRLGTLANLEIFFESSKDIKILTNTRTLKSLAAGAVRKVKILAVKTGLPADEMGTWLKMGVRYTPDYQAILAAVNSETSYPDKFERQKLIDIATRNSETQARHLEAIRHFPENKGQ